ncbi:hypothetical protein H7H80_05515, partial [Mycobacterium interjectum]|nr:hypothetical protein [Mycobacterium interjectum]
MGAGAHEHEQQQPRCEPAALRDGTAGQLKAGFDATMQPYREAVQQLPSYRSTQIESVVIQS